MGYQSALTLTHTDGTGVELQMLTTVTSGGKGRVHPWPKGELLQKKGRCIEHYSRCLDEEKWSRWESNTVQGYLICYAVFFLASVEPRW